MLPEIFQSPVIEPDFVIRDADLDFTGDLNNVTLHSVNRGDKPTGWPVTLLTRPPNLDTFADHELIVQHSVSDTSGNPSKDIRIVFAALQTLACAGPWSGFALNGDTMTRSISRLEKLYFRLEAQHACLAWAFEQISDHPGVVFEIGLGLGRSFDHLRRYLPTREIFVFDREVNSYPDCRPDAQHLLIGELSLTLPQAASRFAGKVILAHSDVGSFSADGNATMSGIVSSHLTPALADGALILSDLPLSIPNARPLPLPTGARDDRYYLYRYMQT